MTDSPLRDGTAGEPVEPDSTDRPAGAADASPGADDVAPVLTVLGSDDGPVCTDGVCVL
ncbi:hypothetical protein [Streptomyces acidicola]|uniref:hypothetical protein n=1 Tax=Streptomyces acidicola TaxID=2596892 RepID=UPI00341E3F88